MTTVTRPCKANAGQKDFKRSGVKPGEFICLGVCPDNVIEAVYTFEDVLAADRYICVMDEALPRARSGMDRVAWAFISRCDFLKGSSVSMCRFMNVQVT